jgi:quinolinate synthase
MVSMCSTMFRIDPQHLAWELENLVAGEVVNQVSVEEEIAHYARVVIHRMLDIKV